MGNLEKIDLGKDGNTERYLTEKGRECKKIARQARGILGQKYNNPVNIEYIGSMEKIRKGEYLFVFNVGLPSWKRESTIAINEVNLKELVEKAEETIKKFGN